MAEITTEVPVTGVAKVADLIPYYNNPRAHTDLDVDRMIGSISAFGFRIPVLVKKSDDGLEVIDGHLRLKAAEKLGLDEVPVLYADDMNADQIRAFRIMVNQSVSWSDWDNAKLHEELQLIAQSELASMHSLESIVGFDTSELNRLSALAELKSGLTDPDVAPPVPEKPVTELGDIWVLGKHRLVCGDCTDADTVAKCLNGVTPHLMVTDPPYGVEYDPKQRGRMDGRKTKRTYMAASEDINIDWGGAWAMFPGDVAYVWHSDKQIIGIGNALILGGFELRQQLIWAKNVITLTRTNFNYQHEHCWYAVRKGKNAHYRGGRDNTTLWKIDKVIADTGHGAQKPVECMKRPIENSSKPGESVYDPFLGSGTTLIAAEMTGRSCYAIELSPAYCDVCVARWQEFTGKQAHIDDGSQVTLETPVEPTIAVIADG